jgi:DNA-binding NtrC family response regulator
MKIKLKNTVLAAGGVLMAEGDRLTVQALKEKLGLQQLIGESPGFLTEMRKIPAMARCEATVFVLGETGTGKELCARAIHYLSARAHKPFLPVNCGAIPTELVENELFGHERAAFIDATTTSYGVIHEADGGTLFLDEIDSLPLLAQVKLLRFLQEREYRPLGSAKTRKAQVRIIAATNADVETAVREGKLRQDLYYRLNILPLVLLPLRQRQEDISLLARHFLHKYAAEFDKPVMNFSPDALQLFGLYDWPGNVRELEHIVERAVALTEQSILGQADLPSRGMKFITTTSHSRRPRPKWSLSSSGPTSNVYYSFIRAISLRPPRRRRRTAGRFGS